MLFTCKLGGFLSAALLVISLDTYCVDQARCRAFAFATAVVAIGFDTALRLCRLWHQNAFCGCLPRGLQFAKSGEYR